MNIVFQNKWKIAEVELAIPHFFWKATVKTELVVKN